MTEAENTYTTTAPGVHRRGLLGRTAAAMLAGTASALATRTAAAAPSVGTDAALLALCAEYHRQHDVAYDPVATDWEDALDETWDIVDELADLPAATEAGRRAKAGVAARLLAVEDRYDHDCRFALAVLRDLAGSAAA